jgi:hypothetical protein
VATARGFSRRLAEQGAGGGEKRDDGKDGKRGDRETSLAEDLHGPIYHVAPGGPVIALIRANRFYREYAECLDPSVREKFR